MLIKIEITEKGARVRFPPANRPGPETFGLSANGFLRPARAVFFIRLAKFSRALLGGKIRRSGASPCYRGGN